MTREEAIKEITNHLNHWKRLKREKICSEVDGENAINSFNMAIKALEQEPSEDAVSRTQAIEFVNEVIGEKNDFADAIRDGVEAVLSALPSVTPTQKKGKWLVNKEKDIICCPFCNDKQKIGKDEVELLNTAFARFNFCTYCGAEMESE